MSLFIAMFLLSHLIDKLETLFSRLWSRACLAIFCSDWLRMLSHRAILKAAAWNDEVGFDLVETLSLWIVYISREFRSHIHKCKPERTR